MKPPTAAELRGIARFTQAGLEKQTMFQWDYLGWEWTQTMALFRVSPIEPQAILLVALYPLAILLGLTLLHRLQLLVSERKGEAKKSADLRRRLRWELRAVVIIFLLWFSAVIVPVFRA